MSKMIAKYGLRQCLKAYAYHRVDGNGDSGVSHLMGVHFNTARGMINAGRDYLNDVGIRDHYAHLRGMKMRGEI